MENASLPSDVWNDVVTTSSSTDDDLSRNLAVIRDVALKIIYIIIGTVGVLDNVCRRPWQLVCHHCFRLVHQNYWQGMSVSFRKLGRQFSDSFLKSVSSCKYMINFISEREERYRKQERKKLRRVLSALTLGIFVVRWPSFLKQTTSFWGVTINRPIRRKIIETVLCCTVSHKSAKSYMHSYEQFVQLLVSLGLYLGFVGICAFWLSLVLF